METKEFKIRLFMYYDEKTCTRHFLDELPKEEYSKVKDLHCLHDWLALEDGDDLRARHRAVYHKLQYGFNNDDIALDVKFENGYIKVTLIAADSFDKLVTVMKDESSTIKPKLITRPLLDWVKISLNGQLSDGIGENPVGTYKSGDVEYELWLGDIVTDIEVDEDEIIDEDGTFFIGEPDSIETDQNVIESLYNIAYKKAIEELVDKYNKTDKKRLRNYKLHL